MSVTSLPDQCYENEHEIGKALTKMLKSGAVKREDLFITGKVWGTSNRGNLVSVLALHSFTN